MEDNEYSIYNMIKESIDAKVLNSDEDDDTKAELITYLICENLKGMKVYIPTKRHKIMLATKWIKENRKESRFGKNFGLDRRTIYKIRNKIKVENEARKNS